MSETSFSDECPIKLLPHQKEHVQKIWNLIVKDKVFSFCDTSTTGSGKTICTLYIAWHLQKYYNTKVMIVAPSDASLNNDDGWVAHSEDYEIDVLEYQTYSGLRGGRGKVAHPWLSPNGEKKKKWKATEYFKTQCSKGLFIIFDEFHACKNASITHFACAALVKAAKEYRSVCRVALLSHTPADKISCYPQILRMTGLITSRKMFKHVPFTSNYEYEQYGLGELERVCTKVSKDPTTKQRFRNQMYRFSAAKCNALVKQMYDQNIRSLITFAMPVSENPYKATLLNAFLETDEDSLALITNGINLLSGAVGWNAALQQIDNQAEWALGQISVALKMIERGKLLTVANYVNREAIKNPNKKFVICCGGSNIKHHDILKEMLIKRYTPDSYKDLVQDLKKNDKNWKRLPKDMINYVSKFLDHEVSPDVLNGKTDKDERVNILRKFQNKNNESWCLIMSPGVGSESISLHDKFGNHPREMLIIPHYFFSRLIQSTGRVNRVGMQSDAKIMIVYSKEAALETSILNSMIRKTQIAKDMLSEDQKVVFPGEFPYWIEGKRDIELENRLNLMQMNPH